MTSTLITKGAKVIFPDKPKERIFTFDEKAHVYTLDGKRMYGTTTVLSVIAKPMLIPWAANMAVDYIETNFPTAEQVMGGYIFSELFKEARVAHTKKKEKAGELGTDIHEQIEKLINSAIELNNGKIEAFMVLDEMPEQVKEFAQWAILSNVLFLVAEKRLYSEEMWTAGTADFICLIAGKLYIGDIKTSSAIYPEMFLQTAAYAHMAMEMGLYDEFHGTIIVNIPKRGGIKVKENYALTENFEAFKAALTLFKFQQSQKINK